MNKTVARCVFVCAVSIWILLSILAPWVLSDNNAFLKGFVNHELLGFLGVVVTITLASAANLHIELNKLEEAAQRTGFTKTRTAIKRSAAALISMLLLAVVVVVAKPLVAPDPLANAMAASFFNGAALLIVLFNVLILIDLTQSAFQLGPKNDS